MQMSASRAIFGFVATNFDQADIETRVAIAGERECSKDVDHAHRPIGVRIIRDLMSGRNFDEIACTWNSKAHPGRRR